MSDSPVGGTIRHRVTNLLARASGALTTFQKDAHTCVNKVNSARSTLTDSFKMLSASAAETIAVYTYPNIRRSQEQKESEGAAQDTNKVSLPLSTLATKSIKGKACVPCKDKGEVVRSQPIPLDPLPSPTSTTIHASTSVPSITSPSQSSSLAPSSNSASMQVDDSILSSFSAILLAPSVESTLSPSADALSSSSSPSSSSSLFKLTLAPSSQDSITDIPSPFQGPASTSTASLLNETAIEPGSLVFVVPPSSAPTFLDTLLQRCDTRPLPPSSIPDTQYAGKAVMNNHSSPSSLSSYPTDSPSPTTVVPPSSSPTSPSSSSSSTSLSPSPSDVGCLAYMHSECPVNRRELGRASWAYLHTLAAAYPNNPSKDHQKMMKEYIRTFAKLYPCGYCADMTYNETFKNPPRLNNQREFAEWMCEIHNEVNDRLGKPLFDCSKVHERWRTGPSDGSCGPIPKH